MFFKSFGDNNFRRTRILPPEPQMVTIGNNVKVAADVYFCSRDVLHMVFNDMDVKSNGEGEKTLWSRDCGRK